MMPVTVKRLLNFFKHVSERTGTPVFSSWYDFSLLKSRLIGLIEERCGRRKMVHGVLVRVAGLGVLIRGESGIGKTACGLRLVECGHLWIADDAVVLEGRGKVLYGRGHEKTREWIAPRGRGIVRAELLVGAGALCKETRVDLIVDFVRESAKGKAVEVGEGEGQSVCTMVGVALPRRRIVTGGDPGRMAGQVIAVAGDLLRSQGGAISNCL
jgi:HPr kinase/phosphorylase